MFTLSFSLMIWFCVYVCTGLTTRMKTYLWANMSSVWRCYW